MKPELTHPLLLRQLKKLGLTAITPPDPETWGTFVAKIDETYKQEDQSRDLLERSVALSSQEMQELHQHLRDYANQLAQEKEKLESSNAELIRLANYDSLTHLPNRSYFIDHLSKALLQFRPLTLLFIDLDGFKLVNDSLGHATGDLLLKEASHRLRDSVRHDDFVARLGGDEFTIILENISPDHVASVCKKILNRISYTYHLQGHEFYISASIGVVHSPQHGRDAATLIKLADTAMYQAKHYGKNRCQEFSETTSHSITEHAQLVQALRKGLDRQEFFFHYQPRVSLQHGLTISVEALIRWQHPERGLIPPSTFIPIAENTGMIQKLGHWVIQTACQQAKDWYDRGQALRVAVNISVRQLQQDDFVDRIKRILDDTQLPPAMLELEITESAAMSNVEDNIKKLTQLKSLGVYIAIDDFGTAYSSLNYLKRLPVDSLKIDRSFVQDINFSQEKDNNTAIVRSIVALGKSMDLQLVAEGVETIEQASFLKDLGCDEAQGFYFSKPMPANDIRSYIVDTAQHIINTERSLS
jgi:diguanylate cyclase (GGDEF)-like protein